MALQEEKVEDNYDYLMTESDTNVLKNLSHMGDHLKSLSIKLREAEAAYEDAKKEYDYYASSVLPMAMFNAGVEELKLSSGGVLSINRKYRCTPNKNAEDRAIQKAWLEEHGLGNLVSVAATVDGAQLDKLKQAGVPYVEVDEMNTNKVKSHIIDLLGGKGGVASIQIEDIPACFHFQEVVDVNINY